MELPESTDECVYFTRRADEDNKLICWVLKEKCPECGEGLMGKPIKDDGKVAIRAKEYICPKCCLTIEKKENEDTLTANIQYTCKCGKEGEAQIPFKRKMVKGANVLPFKCPECDADLDIAKKFKKKKD